MKAISFILCAVALIVLPQPLRASDTNQPPLPALDELFKYVLERARKERDNDHTFATNYVFVRTRTTEYRNAKGEVKKQETKVRTNNPALIIAAAAPKPLPEKPRQRGPARPVSDTHSNVRGKAFEQEEFTLNGDLAQRFDFKLTGRETLNGRRALVVEFQPKAGKLPERNLKDKFVNKAAGRLWFDEGDYALAKADLWLTERVNVIGGLVGAVWKFNFSFEREWLEEGLWFTRKSNWHLEGREFFVHRTVDYHEERTQVRRHVVTEDSAEEPQRWITNLAERPVLAVWRIVDGVTTDPPRLRVAIWADGRMVFSPNAPKWGTNLLFGRISLEELSLLEKRVRATGVFELDRTTHLSPDSAWYCLLLDFDSDRRMLQWDEETELPYYWNEKPPVHGSLPRGNFKRCWVEVNRIALSFAPHKADPVAADFKFPHRTWFIEQASDAKSESHQIRSDVDPPP